MHSHIIGTTESGKSLLAKLLAVSLKKQGKIVAVADPLWGDWGKVDFQTADIDELSEYLRKNRSVYVFVDECGKYMEEGRNTEHSWLTTTGRHWGHSVHLISQRCYQVPKTMREQCKRLFCFNTSASDGVVLADEWNNPVLMECHRIPQFHFYMCGRFQQPQYMQVHNFKSVKAADKSGVTASSQKGRAKNGIQPDAA